MKLKPSDFAGIFPFCCVFGESNHETIALKIMCILERTGNEFRKLSFEEYTTERKKDTGIYASLERPLFNKVIEYCVSAEKAKTFSMDWDI